MVHGVWTHNTIFEMILRGTANGQQVLNVHHFEAAATLEATLISDALAQTSGTTLAGNWLTNCKTAWLAMLPTDYTLSSVDVGVIERPGTANHKLVPTSTITGLPATGASAVTVSSMGAAAVIKWRSLLAGKQHRGRTYVGPLAQQLTVDGMIDAALLTAMTAYRTAMARYRLTGAEALNWLHTVYSRPYDNGTYNYVKRIAGVKQVFYPPDYAGNSSNIITDANDPVGRIIRRREIGVGA